MPKHVWSHEPEQRLMEVWHEIDNSREGRSMTKQEKAEVVTKKLRELSPTLKMAEDITALQVIYKLDTLHRKAKKFYRLYQSKLRTGETVLNLQAACADWANFRVWHQLFEKHPILGAPILPSSPDNHTLMTTRHTRASHTELQEQPGEGNVVIQSVPSVESTVQMSKYCKILPRPSSESVQSGAVVVTASSPTLQPRDHGSRTDPLAISAEALQKFLGSEALSLAGHLSGANQSVTTPTSLGQVCIGSTNGADVIVIRQVQNEQDNVTRAGEESAVLTQATKRHHEQAFSVADVATCADEQCVDVVQVEETPAKVTKTGEPEMQEEIRDSISDRVAAKLEENIQVQLSFQQLQASLATQRIESEERRERQFLEYLERKDRERVMFEERRERERQEYEERRERERRAYEERRDEERQRREDEWRRSNQEFQLKLFMQMEKWKRGD